MNICICPVSTIVSSIDNNIVLKARVRKEKERLTAIKWREGKCVSIETFI